MLEANEIKAGYGESEVLHGVNIKVYDRKINLLIGPNGVGKTTFLKTLAGIIRPYFGKITFEGKEITKLSSRERLKLGITYVPAGGEVFPEMTVKENLEMGAYIINNDKKLIEENLKNVYELFPILLKRKDQKAIFLSGGERQMLSIGRALVSSPKIFLLDEPSTGLDAGKLAVLKNILIQLKEKGMTILLVEQNVKAFQDLVDYVYVMNNGKIIYESDKRLLEDEQMMTKLFFG